MLLVFLFGVFAHAGFYQPTTTLLPVVAFQILESPFDEEKLNRLKPYDLDHVNLSKDDDGNLVAEKYSSSTKKLTVVVTRQADSGKVTNVTVSLVNGTMGQKNLWNINEQTFTACSAGAKGGCKVTPMAACKPDSAQYDNYLVKVCPFLAEVIAAPKAIVDSPNAPKNCSCTPGIQCSCPSATPTPHYHIRPKLKL